MESATTCLFVSSLLSLTCAAPPPSLITPFALRGPVEFASALSSNDTGRRGWVSPPTTRGTSQIIESSLATLFVCLYTAFHDDIPLHHTSKWRTWLHKARWLLVGVITPEFLVILAYLQWAEALRARNAMRRLKVPRWTITHGFYANMGGFVLVSEDGRRRAVNSAQLQLLWKALDAGQVDLRWPDITAEGIMDKSKANILAKLLALVQAAWFLAQIIGRAVQHLAIAPLEVETAAYVSLALFVYLFWLKKPLNVETPTELSIGGALDDAALAAAVPGWREAGEQLVTFHQWRHVLAFFSGDFERSANNVVAAMFLGMMFGGVHCTAWDFSFPTSLERILWRAASVLTVIVGLFAGTTVRCFNRLLRGKFLIPDRVLFERKNTTGFLPSLSYWIWDYAGYPLLLVYMLARVYLIFESFYGLRSLPASAFDTVRWSQYVPHF